MAQALYDPLGTAAARWAKAISATYSGEWDVSFSDGLFADDYVSRNGVKAVIPRSMYSSQEAFVDVMFDAVWRAAESLVPSGELEQVKADEIQGSAMRHLIEQLEG